LLAPPEAKAASSVVSNRRGRGYGPRIVQARQAFSGKEAARHRVPADIYQEVLMSRMLARLSAFAAFAVIVAVGAARALAGGADGGGAIVRIANTPLGRILVDSRGITLYDFVPDKGTTSVCYGACAALWPPLITHGKPVAGPGVKGSLLGTTRRSDGELEVTYAGHPLYYFVTDRHSGQTTGQGVIQFGGPWWVLSAAGKEIHHV
jgi:predicted lipoprotein with Yx(FWY)xxD motif